MWYRKYNDNGKYNDSSVRRIWFTWENIFHVCPFVRKLPKDLSLFTNIRNTRDSWNSVRIVKRSHSALSFRDAKVNVYRWSLNHGCRLISLEAAEYLQFENIQAEDLPWRSSPRSEYIPSIRHHLLPRNIFPTPHWIRSCVEDRSLLMFAKRVA